MPADENTGIGHCGKYCPDWICEKEPKWDDLCVGCPCNVEEDPEEEREDDVMEEEP
jgi:hypothetical protein